MSLSPEDLLRLNVLLAHDLQAVRIDEQALTVHGLTLNDEARIPLNPNCRPAQYLKRVRETLSNHALGSPGGYPVFLQRWTRMGQAKDAQLEKLLLLGEGEAVVAVAGAPGLTDDIARRAWWAMPTADIARRMLERETVVQGSMGKVLAAYLVEHLPFETDPLTIITTVRLV
ncbi:MAG: sulfur reduction protein DsrS, partial [Pseudomonadota bacterium]